MTVLVGVLCADGVVVGSDSSATFEAGPNLRTIEQPVRKTFIVGNDVILATTGAGGLGQRLALIVEQMRLGAGEWHACHHMDIAINVSRNMLQNLQATFLNPGQLGALVAYTCRGALHLCEFAVPDFQPEMKTEETWFVSMGSGQMITDPFFGLLRRTLFRKARPTLSEGVLAAYWALHNAIELNTGGINGPVQLTTLRRPLSGDAFEARLLDDDQLGEHKTAVESLELYLATYRDQIASPALPLPTPEPAAPPTPDERPPEPPSTGA